MSSIHFNLNRPVHLARRNVFFERAVELLHQPIGEADTVLRVQHVEHISALLKTSELHAFFALRSGTATPEEESFLHFLKLTSDNVQSIHAMIRHQLQLESGGGFLSDFLGTTPRQALLPALHYQRRAEDIMQGLRHLLQEAQAPYVSLRDKNMDALEEPDRARYDLALASFKDEVQHRYTPPASKDEAMVQEEPVPSPDA